MARITAWTPPEPLENKIKIRKQIEKETQEFLARGGEIVEIGTREWNGLSMFNNKPTEAYTPANKTKDE